MAKVDYFVCDICGKAIEEDTGFDRHLVLEVYMSAKLKEKHPMTNSIVEDEQAVDLCDECATELLGCFENIAKQNKKNKSFTINSQFVKHLFFQMVYNKDIAKKQKQNFKGGK